MIRKKPDTSIPIKELAEEIYLRGYDPGAYGYFKAPKRFFDPETGLGVNYSVYTFAATVAEVEVDTETGEIRVTRIWPAMDCGKAIDPMIIEGQVEGAISQGLGFTLMENMELNDNGTGHQPQLHRLRRTQQPRYSRDRAMHHSREALQAWGIRRQGRG